MPFFLAPPPVGCSASEEAHKSRTRAQIGGLEIAISAFDSHGDDPDLQLLLQKGLERHRLRAELRLMKALHLQLKQAIELQGKASKRTCSNVHREREPEPQVVVRQKALATNRAHVIAFQSEDSRLC